MHRNHESFGPVMNQAVDILSTLHELNGHHEPIGHQAIEYRTLRHGVFEAHTAGLYYKNHPEDLEKDINRYGELLDVADIQLGYVLHDSLGKPWANADARIWYTNARVTPDELKDIRYHHKIGHDRLHTKKEEMTQTKIHQVAYDICLWHHEKLDGSGPQRKTKETLPHAVQVAAVIDQIISRCQPSPYWSQGFNLRSSITEVHKGYGKEYNPEVLDNLQHLFEQNTHMELPGLRWLGEF